ncbi:hypothetical protein LY78DRAFT_645650 [Colletotrichum sublineola]|uniref:Siderophore biosynthesis enzyme n=1 Tax=Colletotrichum sublineola TaxID=1173701 RepID=A0A066X7N5_COLSU|nr:hypothetical protein LY78DRAFT_645650 [Colletotrichum sublineola]KDN65153.1 hypothetical protein CSUB01_09466 [Colletotrichum sublineola]
MSYRLVASVAILATAAMAKTDLAGCVSSEPTQGGSYAANVWYVPGTGEICEPLDCGGGRAPPKTDVPGCPEYKGSETYAPSFLPLETSAAPVAHPTIPSVITAAPERAVPTMVDSPAPIEIKPSKSEEVCSEDDVTSAAPVAPVVTHVVSPAGQNATATFMITTPKSAAGYQTPAGHNGSVPTSTVVKAGAAGPIGASRELISLVAGMGIIAAALLY